MRTTVRWGLLSTARINRLVLAGARESDRVDVVAVASRDRARAEEYARENGIERAYESYEALLADPDVEAVYISLPNSLHVEWSIRALQAGKHVLCEKPLSRRRAEVEEAFDVAERAGLALMEAFMYRHNPQTARLKELVEQGAIGRLRLIRATFSFPLTDAENIRLDPALDGGGLMDVGCYCVSGSRLLAGEPREVFGVVFGSGFPKPLARLRRDLREGAPFHQHAVPRSCALGSDHRRGEIPVRLVEPPVQRDHVPAFGPVGAVLNLLEDLCRFREPRGGPPEALAA
jgi:predicted dehydrogenase